MEPVALRWQEVHGRKPTEEDIERMFAEFIRRGLKIGSTTGYMTEMMAILLAEAKKRGYEPDSSVCAAQVPEGRPAPWMCIQNAMELGVYPFESCVKVDDTLPGIEEGLNAGMWTIGLAKTGNEVGLNEEEINNLPPEFLQRRLDRAYRRMYQTGAHYVVDGTSDVPPILDEIGKRLASGERP
ncbi:MAG: HAD-IA family hydrolase [Anaerolineales bacterium]